MIPRNVAIGAGVLALAGLGRRGLLFLDGPGVSQPASVAPATYLDPVALISLPWPAAPAAGRGRCAAAAPSRRRPRPSIVTASVDPHSRRVPAADLREEAVRERRAR